ncbi:MULTISPECIES: ABC transporter ATP-binding protein [Paenibacillus]|uniref:ABC transporter ATP-binding protein n=1 Tax=Paenibacillus TaxID=44249 RepID=UPI002FE145CC
MIMLENVRHPMGELTLEIGKLRIPPGLTLLVGANGAGKTTLLELLATLQLPRKGEILYRQRSAAEDLPLLRSQIGYVPAEIELYEEMTVYRLLVYLAELKGVYQREWIEALLSDFRLTPYRNQKIKTLSLGTRRRIVLAQALLAAPYFLFLDEPLNAMDTAERKMAISYLSRYAAGRTVVAAVHEMNEWDEAADHVIWLDRGRIGYEGGSRRWNGDLPLEVWEGLVTREQFENCPPGNLIHFREMADGIHVRLIGGSRLFPGLTLAEPTLEDAYFVRQYGRDRVVR